MRARGRTAQRVAKRARGTVTPEESLTAALEPGHAGFASTASASPTTRRWRSNTPPCSPRACPRSMPSRRRFTRRWSRPGNRPVRALQRLRAVLLTRRAGRAAQARSQATRDCSSSGSASSQDGRAVEFSQSYYRGDTYDFVAELSARVVETRMFREAARSCRGGARAVQTQPRIGAAPRRLRCANSRRAPSSPARAAAPITRPPTRSI